MRRIIKKSKDKKIQKINEELQKISINEDKLLEFCSL